MSNALCISGIPPQMLGAFPIPSHLRVTQEEAQPCENVMRFDIATDKHHFGDERVECIRRLQAIGSCVESMERVVGDADLLVPIEGSQAFHKAQKEAGVDSRFQTMPKQGHMVTFLNPETSITMLGFFQEVLGETRAKSNSTSGAH